MNDDRLPTATLVADLRFLADADVESASRYKVPAWRIQSQERADVLRQAADRLEELTEALRPFARWYSVYGEEIAADAVADYRRAAELLGEEPTR